MARMISDDWVIRAILYFEGTAPASLVHAVYSITAWLGVYDPEDEDEIILANKDKQPPALLNSPSSRYALPTPASWARQENLDPNRIFGSETNSDHRYPFSSFK